MSVSLLASEIRRMYAKIGPLWRHAPSALATLVLAHASIARVLASTGRPAVPLDDAFIHFQFARRLAEGHFFSYSAGESYVAGATSLLWPAVLAIFYKLGLHDFSIVWAAWALSYLALFGLAYETCVLAQPLAGEGPALGAGGMVLAFGGYAWCAGSGMEVVPFAYVLARSTRRAAEWWELGASAPASLAHRSRRMFASELLAYAAVAPLLRPEGALTSVIMAVALSSRASHERRAGLPMVARSCQSGETRVGRLPSSARWRAVSSSLSSALLALVPSGVHRLCSGSWTSTTARVKWLIGNPYYPSLSRLARELFANASTLLGQLLDGRQHSALFVPAGSLPVALAGLTALVVIAWQPRHRFRALAVLVVALGMFIPCSYVSFLWNRLRYLWPFAFAWFVGVACAARLVGQLVARYGSISRSVPSLLSGLCAGALASHLRWSLDDLAQSAAAIDGQQVKLGLWAAEHLPPDSRIGVNDTGAIAYFGARPTFDIVGLTTPSEGAYWVMGAGSRYEHYERLWERGGVALPTHFIVYPGWMACDPVLGEELARATVTEQTILGGPTMVAYRADYGALGLASEPDAAPAGRLMDELDVADLESEFAHHYQLGETSERDNVVLTDEGGVPARFDGARVRRTRDEFELRTSQPVPASSTHCSYVLVARVASTEATTLQVHLSGPALGRSEDTNKQKGGERTLDTDLPVAASAWSEVSVALAFLAPGTLHVRIQSRGSASFGSAHYWLYQREQQVP